MSEPTDKPIDTNASVLNEGEGEPGFTRSGPVIDVERFKQEYLFGVPLVAALTGQEITDTTLKQFIRKGISDFETSVRIPVTPVRITDRFDFERADDLNFGTRRLTRWPLLKVEELSAVWPGRTEEQKTPYPTDWVTPDGDTGLIRIVPVATGNSVSNNADSTFINSNGYRAIVLGGMKAWPNMWRITYIAGFAQDKVPDAVNDLIGTMAAIKFLSQMGPAIFPYNSFSIGIDGMSQGTANAGPQWLSERIQELTVERDRMVAQLKAHYATDLLFAAF